MKSLTLSRCLLPGANNHRASEVDKKIKNAKYRVNMSFEGTSY